MKAKRFLLTTLALVLVAAISITGTIAFLRTKEQNVSNVFTIGDDLTIALTEDVALIRNNENILDVSIADDGDTVKYGNVLPGDYLKKTVNVANTSEVNAYVKVTVTMNNANLLNLAIDEYYEGIGYSASAVQAMYDHIFDGWNINYNPRPGKNGKNNARGVIETQNDTILKVDFSKTTDWSTDTVMFDNTNWFMSAKEKALAANGQYGGLHPASDGYYTSQLKDDPATAAVDERDYNIVYTYYIYLEAGKNVTLFNGIRVPQEFTYEQLKMFKDLKIDVAASAIQADNIVINDVATVNDDLSDLYRTKEYAIAAFTYLAEMEGKTAPDNNLVGKPDFDVILTKAELLDAIAKGGEYTLGSNIKVDETIVIEDGVTVTLDLAGNAITGSIHKSVGAVIKNNGTLNISGGTISSTAANGGSAIANNGVLNITDVTVNGAKKEGSDWPSYAINNYGVMTAENATIVSNHGAVASNADSVANLINCNINLKGIGGSSHIFYASKGSVTTVDGGTYVHGGNVDGSLGYIMNGAKLIINDGTFSASNGGYGFAASTGAEIIVNGGTVNSQFQGWGGTITISGGIFAKDPTAFVATGYKVIVNNGKYCVVANTVNEVVSTPAEFESALSDAADAGSGDNTIYLLGDINLGGAAWTPINVDGYNGAGVVTVEGNGATIKGLTAPLFAGGFAGKSGIVIKNLTIADSNIVSTSGLGGGAFIDSADSMHKITLENCHLINSTVSGERTGGLIGWCTGYAKLNDGPVKAYVTISDCSVIDSTIIGAGSAGAIAGHPGASDYTYTTIEDCEVKNVKVISNETGSWRTGAIVGTANNGHVTINNVDVENVTLTQNGVTAETTVLYGRFVPSGTGTLVIDGVSYVTNNDALKAAIANGESTVALESGSYDLNGIQKDGLTLIGVGKEVNVANTTKYASGSAVGAIWKAINLENVTITNTVYTMADGGNATFTNVNFAAGFRQGYGKAVVFNDCTFGSNSEGYALHFQSDSASEGGVITLNGCEFEGGKVHLGGKRAYAFTGCDFAAGTDFQVWSNITLDGCTVDGVEVTVDNADTLFPNLDLTKVTFK